MTTLRGRPAAPTAVTRSRQQRRDPSLRVLSWNAGGLGHTSPWKMKLVRNSLHYHHIVCIQEHHIPASDWGICLETHFPNATYITAINYSPEPSPATAESPATRSPCGALVIARLPSKDWTGQALDSPTDGPLAHRVAAVLLTHQPTQQCYLIGSIYAPDRHHSLQTCTDFTDALTDWITEQRAHHNYPLLILAGDYNLALARSPTSASNQDSARAGLRQAHATLQSSLNVTDAWTYAPPTSPRPYTYAYHYSTKATQTQKRTLHRGYSLLDFFYVSTDMPNPRLPKPHRWHTMHQHLRTTGVSDTWYTGHRPIQLTVDLPSTQPSPSFGLLRVSPRHWTDPAFLHPATAILHSILAEAPPMLLDSAPPLQDDPDWVTTALQHINVTAILWLLASPEYLAARGTTSSFKAEALQQLRQLNKDFQRRQPQRKPPMPDPSHSDPATGPAAAGPAGPAGPAEPAATGPTGPARHTGPAIPAGPTGPAAAPTMTPDHDDFPPDHLYAPTDTDRFRRALQILDQHGIPLQFRQRCLTTAQPPFPANVYAAYLSSLSTPPPPSPIAPALADWKCPPLPQPQLPTRLPGSLFQVRHLDIPISLGEVYAALLDCPRRKAPGPDGLPVEVYLAAGAEMTTRLFLAYCYLQQHPELAHALDFPAGATIALHKKGEVNDPANYRPITLLNSDYKILAKLMSRRLGSTFACTLPPGQVGFLQGRNIGDNIMTLRARDHRAWALHQREIHRNNIYTENKNKNQQTLRSQLVNPHRSIAVLIDMSKAFDTITREHMWKCMADLGIPDQFITWARDILFCQTTSRAVLGAYVSTRFQTTTGVRQGCPLSPLLYLAVGEAMRTYLLDRMAQELALTDPDPTVRRENAEKALTVLQYADDTALILEDPRHLAALMQWLSEYGQLSGQQVNHQKSVVWRLGDPRIWDNTTDPANQAIIKTCHEFHLELLQGPRTPLTYLGIDPRAHDPDTDILQTHWASRYAKWTKALHTLKGWASRVKGGLPTKCRAALAEVYLISTILYHAVVSDCPPKLLATMQAECDRFVNRDSKPNLIRRYLRIPLAEGGPGFPDLALRIHSGRAMWSKAALFSPKPWCALFRTTRIPDPTQQGHTITGEQALWRSYTQPIRCGQLDSLAASLHFFGLRGLGFLNTTASRVETTGEPQHFGWLPRPDPLASPDTYQGPSQAVPRETPPQPPGSTPATVQVFLFRNATTKTLYARFRYEHPLFNSKHPAALDFKDWPDANSQPFVFTPERLAHRLQAVARLASKWHLPHLHTRVWISTWRAHALHSAWMRNKPNICTRCNCAANTLTHAIWTCPGQAHVRAGLTAWATPLSSLSARHVLGFDVPAGWTTPTWDIAAATIQSILWRVDRWHNYCHHKHNIAITSTPRNITLDRVARNMTFATRLMRIVDPSFQPHYHCTAPLTNLYPGSIFLPLGGLPPLPRHRSGVGHDPPPPYPTHNPAPPPITTPQLAPPHTPLPHLPTTLSSSPQLPQPPTPS